MESSNEVGSLYTEIYNSDFKKFRIQHVFERNNYFIRNIRERKKISRYVGKYISWPLN